MKTLTLWVAAIASAASGPSLACSPSLTPFSEVVDEADFAFYGRAEVRMERVPPAVAGGAEESERLYRGEVRFRGIECYAPPRGDGHCPRALNLPFEVVDDGYNCPSWVLWYRPNRDRYFTLWRDEDGRWQLGGTWRRFGRR